MNMTVLNLGSFSIFELNPAKSRENNVLKDSNELKSAF